METKIIELLQKLILNEELSILELNELKHWINNPDNQLLLNKWIQSKWDKAPAIESKVSFEQLITQIENQFNVNKTTKIWDFQTIKYFQRIAAIFILPITILAGYYFFFSNVEKEHYAEAISPKGQKSEIVLPDSTHIWLNSDSRLLYPTQFGKKERKVFLKGEAYFEVKKKEHQPFIVNASKVDIKVLGTKFNVKAYTNDEKIEAALLSGKINLMYQSGSSQQRVIEMKPGEMIEYSKKDRSVLKTDFDSDETIGWKNNKLIFRDDTFDNLVKKVERWYNVEIIYDKELLKNQHLTVELLEGENLECLMEIIEKAIGVNYKIDKQKIYINSK